MTGGALSQNQYSAAQKYCPDLLSKADAQNSPRLQALHDREVQETLKNEFGYMDRSKEGYAAYKDNCDVIHHPSKHENDEIQDRSGWRKK